MAYYGKLNLIVDTIGLSAIKEYYSTHTQKDTANYFKIEESVLQRILKKYHIIKNAEQKRISIQNNNPNFYKERAAKTKINIINKYGSLEAFEEIHSQKIIKGRLKKYGTKEKYIEAMTKTLKNTIKQKYGVENISQLDEIKDKKKQTLINNFGSTENAYKIRQKKINNTIIAKYGSLEDYRAYQQKLARQTYNKKYGVDSPLKSTVIQDKIKKTIEDKYGVSYACMIKGVGPNSSYNTCFAELLDKNGINYTREFGLDNYIYDFKVDNILIEINPFATHNSTFSPYGSHTGKDKYYHQNKAKVATLNNFKIINIWDWTDKNLVINMLKSNIVKPIKYFIEPQLIFYDYELKTIVKNKTTTSVEIYDEGAIYE